MKKILSFTLASALVFPVAAFAQGLKIGTVDMNRAFKEYNKTKDAEAKINDAKNAGQKRIRRTRRRLQKGARRNQQSEQAARMPLP